MKKYIIFMSIVIILVIGFIYYLNRPRDYTVEYNINEYKILENYSKNDKYYLFDIMVDDLKFNFVSDIKYSHNRKIIKDIEVNKKDDILCIKPIIDGDDIEPICHNGSEFIDKYLANLASVKESQKINEYNNVKIYDSKNEYLIWNNKGLTNLNDKKGINFLSKESYDNLLAYQYDRYIIIADYDQNRSFDKFYIYDNNTKKIEEWKLDFSISFESYFMGDIEDYIYLFDKKNKVQYRLDIKKKIAKITSDKDGAIFYDKGYKTLPINNLIYSENPFIYENKYNFLLDKDTLYMRLFNSNENVRITSNKVDHIVRANEKCVYYLVNENLYSYTIGEGERLLLVNFEWNFSYLNKIFIFN